jgi:hypothetical protein
MPLREFDPPYPWLLDIGAVEEQANIGRGVAPLTEDHMTALFDARNRLSDSLRVLSPIFYGMAL